MRIVKLGVLFLTLVTTIAVSSSLSVAQTTIALERLQIDLWPEFDTPEMLVIYRGTLPQDTPLPASLTLRLPKGIGQPHAVAYKDETGNLFDAEHTVSETDDWMMITLETPELEFQLEFYEDLEYSGDQRHYTLVWPGDYAVGQLDISLLPPTGATEIQTDPILALAQQGTGSFGYQADLGSQAEGEETQIIVSYNGAEVVIGQTPLPSFDKESRSVSNNSNNTWLIAALIITALALVTGGGVWYTRQPRPQSVKVPPTQRRHAKRKQRLPKTRKTERGPSPARYCTQCGHALHAQDRFCGSCGTPVKGINGSQ